MVPKVAPKYVRSELVPYLETKSELLVGLRCALGFELERAARGERRGLHSVLEETNAPQQRLESRLPAAMFRPIRLRAWSIPANAVGGCCLLYTSDAADE